MKSTAVTGQAMAEYLVACAVIVAMLTAPLIDTPHPDGDEKTISIGQLIAETAKQNLNAWQFSTRLAD